MLDRTGRCDRMPDPVPDRMHRMSNRLFDRMPDRMHRMSNCMQNCMHRMLHRMSHRPTGIQEFLALSLFVFFPDPSSSKPQKQNTRLLT